MSVATLAGFVVLAVGMGGVIGLGVFVCGGVSSDTKESRVKGDAQALGSAVKMYAINAGHPPTTAQGLEALVSTPTLPPVPDCHTPLIKEVPCDPWGTPYGYSCHPRNEGGWEFEIRSAGKDGVFGSEDDISFTDDILSTD